MPRAELPLVAILRGLEPARAVDVAHTVFDAGWRLVEVPLNRAGALECIAAIARSAPVDALVGGARCCRQPTSRPCMRPAVA